MVGNVVTYKLTKTALNANVVIWAQTEEYGITVSKLSMWDKLLHYTIGMLQQENNGSMSMAKLAGAINMEKATQFTWGTISMLVLSTNLFNNYHKAVLTEHHHFAQFCFVVTWQNSWPPDETLQHVWPSFGKLQQNLLYAASRYFAMKLNTLLLFKMNLNCMMSHQQVLLFK